MMDFRSGDTGGILKRRHGFRWLGPLCLAFGIVAGAIAVPANAQDKPVDFNLRVIQSGHSLTDPIPPMLEKMIAAQGGGMVQVARSTIPGSTMDWRWAHPTTPLPNAKTEIGKYDLLVLTERVSLSGTTVWHKSDEEALRWTKHAWENGNDGKGAETMLYATWVEITSGPDYINPYKDVEGHIPFRERMPLEWARWEKIAAYVNENRPEGSPFVRMIPGPLLFAELYDEIEAGNVPGLTNASELFLDDIHINDLGAYFITLAHYAMIYNQDPRGLPANIRQGQKPSPEMAAKMQEIVWKVLTSYPGSGVS
ncbi:hypothetical protein FPY71_12380 [Aureimonas fodinaquatilis]|uniref:SGNH/GDSL hydrolase family protein n=1 Tax=Aureimonas fodinaquatilis TaxID=2565783 RepID=A0A5B0DRC4_9HYPH|nr:hypothetical protein [Aureimonas fodinaquatilis]KAA0969347.1 hypothetical protein FPY71_12380 [Aureimonas fodinaquatilis]